MKAPTMHYIKKYSDGWAIHDDNNKRSRLLTPQEVKAVESVLNQELQENVELRENFEAYALRVRFVEQTFQGRKYITIPRIDIEEI